MADKLYAATVRWKYTRLSGDCVKPVRTLYSTPEAATRNAVTLAGRFADRFKGGIHEVDPETLQIVVEDFEMGEEEPCEIRT